MHFVGTAVDVRALHVMPDVEGPEGELHTHDYRIEVVVERERLDDRGHGCDLDALDAGPRRHRRLRADQAAYETVSDGVVTKHFVGWPFRYTRRFEAEHLLERAGFVVESVQGGYHGEAFTSDSSVPLLVGRRRD